MSKQEKDPNRETEQIKETEKNKKYPTPDEKKTDVEDNTGKRPEKDTNPLPPNPNKVDDHD